MLLIYFWIAIYYLETVFRIMSSGKIIGPGTFYSLIFGLPIAILCYLVCSLFKESRRNTVGLGIMGIITILFMSQFIYFKIVLLIFGEFAFKCFIINILRALKSRYLHNSPITIYDPIHLMTYAFIDHLSIVTGHSCVRVTEHFANHFDRDVI